MGHSEELPERLGSYRILRELGAGGMGHVYLGRSPGGRQVAVKVIRPELAHDRQFRQRFAREVRAARAVSGAYTAAVVDADPDGSPPWMATAYVPGPTLTESVRSRGPLPEPEARRLGAGLAEAVQAIHTAGLVHRDLKPPNVLLSPDGPRVVDFGIALVESASRLTGTRVVMGTPSYMAPEQLKGVGTPPASDLFSLGAILVFAVTGHPPFPDPQALISEEPVLDHIPPGLRRAVAWCLQKEPEARPSPEALLRELVSPPRTPPTVPLSTPTTSAVSRDARTLLAAGLTDEMTTEAMDRVRR